MVQVKYIFVEIYFLTKGVQNVYQTMWIEWLGI